MDLGGHNSSTIDKKIQVELVGDVFSKVNKVSAREWIQIYTVLGEILFNQINEQMNIITEIDLWN